MPTLCEQAIYYASLGMPIIPCRPNGKEPILGTKDATTDERTIRKWWSDWPNANIGVACGREDIGLCVVDIDVKPDQGIDGWKAWDEISGGEWPTTPVSRTPTGGAHYIFRSDDLPKNKNSWKPGIDIRAHNYYIVVPPSVHPNGGVYEWEKGQAPGDIPFAEYPDSARPQKKTYPWSTPATSAPVSAPALQATTSNMLDRAKAYLDRCNPAIQGQAGHDTLLFAARAMVVGFEFDKATATELLWSHYNPRCIPQWDRGKPSERRDFERKVDEAIKTPGKKPRGWLRKNDNDFTDVNNDTRTWEYGESLRNALMLQIEKKQESEETETPSRTGRDPSYHMPDAMPEHLLTPPGMVGRVCAWINSSARHKQPLLTLGNVLAFFGALQGRKVRDQWDLRTNIYTMGVAASCAGKDHSRKRIKKICEECNISEALLGGEDVTSDAAIEQRLTITPSMLYLWDEIGHMMGAIKASSGSNINLKKIVPTLMKLYSSASTTYIGKEYADGSRKNIAQPCCCLYGTTVPGRLYDGISTAELIDGWLGRVVCFLSEDDDPEPNDDIPELNVPNDIIEHVVEWMNYQPSQGDSSSDIVRAQGLNPRVIETTKDAQARFLRLRQTARREKRFARELANGTDALWGRAEEHARKIALIIACSESIEQAQITEEHACYACELVHYCTLKVIRAVERHVSDTRTEADKKKILGHLENAGQLGMSRSQLTRRTQQWSKRQRDEHIEDLIQAGLVNAGTRGISSTLYYYAHPHGINIDQGE